MNVLDLVTGSLRDATVVGQTKTPSAEQGADAVIRLNQLMASLEEDGINLGYNPKSTTADTLALPDGEVVTIRALLTVSLCDTYGLPVPPVSGATAKAGYDRLLRKAIYSSMNETRTDNAPRGNAQGAWYDITR